MSTKLNNSEIFENFLIKKMKLSSVYDVRRELAGFLTGLDGSTKSCHNLPNMIECIHSGRNMSHAMFENYVIYVKTP